MKRIRLLAALLAAAAAAPGLALDSPHDGSWSPKITCKSCHVLHNAPGVSLTTYEGNEVLCSSCHALYSGSFGFPWSNADQAETGAQGIHHRWDRAALSPAHGAEAPLDAKMGANVEKSGGIVTCSACHDVHAANDFADGARQHVSIPLGTGPARVTGTGTGTVALTSVAPDATARSYALRIVLGGAAGTATFQVSNDDGKTWYGWNAGTSAWEAANVNGRPIPATGPVALNDGAKVTVTFTGADAASFVGGATPDRWKSFYVSYPFMRMSVKSSALCEDCHRSRVQSPTLVENQDPTYRVDGVREFSHPSGPGVVLARAYDRGHPGNGGLRDATGVDQSAGDGNTTNDLALDDAGQVRCLTCHSVHNADSNAGTVDLR